MPYKVDWIPETHIIKEHIWGVPTIKDLNGASHEVARLLNEFDNDHPGQKAHLFVQWDSHNLFPIGNLTDILNQLPLNETIGHRAFGKCAQIGMSKMLLYLLNKMYKRFGLKVQSCVTETEAMKWLTS